MIRKLIGSGLAGALLGLFALASVAGAQGGDFNSLIAQAASQNQTLVNQIQTAQTAPDLATLHAGAQTALATGQAVETSLEAAQAAATTDADRSRASGLEAHVEAALNSLKAAAAATTLAEGQSNLEAARAEAVEARSEFPPVTVTQSSTSSVTQAPPTLPVTGDPGLAGLLVVGAAGVALAAAGMGLRRLQSA